MSKITIKSEFKTHIISHKNENKDKVLNIVMRKIESLNIEFDT